MAIVKTTNLTFRIEAGLTVVVRNSIALQEKRTAR